MTLLLDKITVTIHDVVQHYNFLVRNSATSASNSFTREFASSRYFSCARFPCSNFKPCKHVRREYFTYKSNRYIPSRRPSREGPQGSYRERYRNKVVHGVTWSTTALNFFLLGLFSVGAWCLWRVQVDSLLPNISPAMRFDIYIL